MQIATHKTAGLFSVCTASKGTSQQCTGFGGVPNVGPPTRRRKNQLLEGKKNEKKDKIHDTSAQIGVFYDLRSIASAHVCLGIQLSRTDGPSKLYGNGL
jgi:hypothetical protein